MKKPNNYFDAKSREGVLAALRSANVAKVELVVSGGGDEGMIDSIVFADKDGDPIKESSLQEDVPPIIMRGRDRTKPLAEAAQDLLLETLENQGADWWNNEGGDGMITLNVKTGTVAINIDVNEVRSENVVDIKDAPWSTV